MKNGWAIREELRAIVGEDATAPVGGRDHLLDQLGRYVVGIRNEAYAERERVNLRDHFAGLALQPILAAALASPARSGQMQDAAVDAYAVADALLARREIAPGGGGGGMNEAAENRGAGAHARRHGGDDRVL